LTPQTKTEIKFLDSAEKPFQTNVSKVTKTLKDLQEVNDAIIP